MNMSERQARMKSRFTAWAADGGRPLLIALAALSRAVGRRMTTRPQRPRMLRQTIAGYLAMLLLVSCTTVTPPAASHPSKSLDAQGNDKYECWTEARSLTGHDPEGSSRGAKILGAALMVASSGYLRVRSGAPWHFIPLPLLPMSKHEPLDPAVIERFREAYVTCLTGRGYSVEGV